MKLTHTLTQYKLSWMDQVYRSILFKKLEKLTEGHILIEESFLGSDSQYSFGIKNAAAEHQASLRIVNPKMYARIVLGGSVGAGESYFLGEWETEQLTNLIRIFAINRNLLSQMEGGLGFVSAGIRKIFHTFHPNTIQGAQKNIHAHYDLGNNFFELFLDSSWMYSAAYFKTKQESLEEAQFEKLDRIARKLNLKPEHHLIEIGSGWGGFAIHAAKHYGCKVTTATISQAQFQLANERIKKENLSHLIEVVFCDYRKLEGKYDKLVSIEMIEAVGLDYLEVYFEKCSSLLKDNGQMLLQAITIRDEFYVHAKKNVDFIQRYIFPGSGIPSMSSMMNAIAKKTDLQLTDLEDFGQDYALTLKLWSERLKLNHQKVLQLNYPESLYRMWQFYFSYCEGGFLEKSIGVSQLSFHKPRSKI